MTNNEQSYKKFQGTRPPTRSYIDRVEVAYCISKHTQAAGRRGRFKQPPEIVCATVRRYGGHWLGSKEGLPNQRVGQILSKFQKAFFI